jgi:omega-6 fatty acid desaturase (delta-12 desaturase)
LRTGRDLIEATRDFAPESRLRSWWSLLSTTALLAGSLVALAQPIFWPLRLALAVVAGLLCVREFILFHDYMHGALLRGSRLARIILYPFGIYVMTPPRVWRETHNYHRSWSAPTSAPSPP